MRTLIGFLCLLISSFAYSLEWSYRTYETAQEGKEKSWMPVTPSQKQVHREFQGFIEYNAVFNLKKTNTGVGVYLGKIGDVDKVYINGVLIGQTGDFPPNYRYNMDVERHYFIPAAILHVDRPNQINVITYSKYLVNKGLNTSQVIIGESSSLQHHKYVTEVWDNFSKIIVPLLCLILAAISFPLLAPKAFWCQQSVIFLIGIFGFLLGICRGRVAFHFLEMLLTYKITIVSSILTIWLISMGSIQLKNKIQKVIGSFLAVVAISFITAISLQNELIAAANVAKIWFHVAPVFLLISIGCAFHSRSKDIPLKVGLIILFFADLNDVLNDLKIITSPSLLQTGIGLFVLFLILNQIIRLRKSWELFFKKEFELESDAILGRQAIQLAHDIRSPLEALKSAKDEIAKLPELERDSVNLAMGRIEEIAYNLLVMRKKSKREELGYAHVKSTLTQIIQEKKMQYRGTSELVINFISSKNSFSAFSSIEADTLKRIISNLIDNAAEAMSFDGKVDLRLKVSGSSCQIEVLDSGPTLPSHHLQKIFEKGFTTKCDGNGLGLCYVKQTVEEINGTVTFVQEDKTIVTVNLPLMEPPSYFASQIDIDGIDRIIILDDDESIHQVWRKKFKGTHVTLEHFYKAANLLGAYKEIPNDRLLLSDFELLGEEVHGISCINSLRASSNSILVTARADDPQIIKLCEQYSIKLLPKSIANDIDVCIMASNKKVVLIDDDKLTHLSWKLAAKRSEIDLKSYFSIADFIKDSDKIEHTTPIYIDSHLGENLKGEVLSEEIYKLGFTELFLATGYTSENINRPSWIKDILGKRPPFDPQASSGS